MSILPTIHYKLFATHLQFYPKMWCCLFTVRSIGFATALSVLQIDLSVSRSSVCCYTPSSQITLGEQSGVLKESMIKVYLRYRNIDEILKLLKKNELIGLHFVDTQAWSVESLAPALVQVSIKKKIFS